MHFVKLKDDFDVVTVVLCLLGLLKACIFCRHQPKEDRWNQGELNRRRGRLGFRTLCCNVYGLLKNQFLRNNNNKGSRSNVNKLELVNCESSIIFFKKIEKVKDFSFRYIKDLLQRHFQSNSKLSPPPPFINTPEMRDVCLSLVLLFTIFIIVVTQKLVLQQSKNVTTNPILPPPSVQYLLAVHFTLHIVH